MTHSKDCMCEGSEVVGIIILKVDPGMIPCESDASFLHDLGVGVAEFVRESGDGLTCITVPTGVPDGPLHPASG